MLPQQNLQKGVWAHTLAASLQNPQVQLKPCKIHGFMLLEHALVCACWFSVESHNLQQLGGAYHCEKWLRFVTARSTTAQMSVSLLSRASIYKINPCRDSNSRWNFVPRGMNSVLAKDISETIVSFAVFKKPTLFYVTGQTLVMILAWIGTQTVLPSVRISNSHLQWFIHICVVTIHLCST